jgi:Kef-type K+ transport system membrane component KefB
MSPFTEEWRLELLWILLVLLITTRIAGVLAVRFRQPPLVGELLAGLSLGMIVRGQGDAFPILAGLTNNEVFHALTDLGIFFLMLHAGIEMRVSRLLRSSGSALLVAAGGMLLPLAMGIGLGFAILPESGARFAQALFLGTALAITAVPVAIKVLQDLGQLETRLGRTVVSAAVIDDVLSLLLLAVLTALLRTGELPAAAEVALLAGRIALFFVISLAAGRWLVPRIGNAVAEARSPELEFSAVVVLGLGLSLLAEWLGLHFLVGAFVAGLSFSRNFIDDSVYKDVEARVSGITGGFLAPIFFASIGLNLELSAVREIPGVLAALIGAAFLGKLVGAGLTARLAGLAGREATAVGLAMSSRGAVELVIADVAMRAGMFDRPDPPPDVITNLFSAVVVMAVVTTVASPILLERLLRDREEAS